MKPEEMQQIVWQPMFTTLLSDNAYIEVGKVNTEVHTFLMEKKSEPNFFRATKYEKGNLATEYADEFNARD